MVVRQIRVGSDNYSYLIHDRETREAALVDPGFNASEALSIISDEDLVLKYVINTHHHSDHTATNSEVLQRTGAKLAASTEDGSRLKENVDLFLSEGDEIFLGCLPLEFLSTPGHTPGGLCIIVEKEFLITGDTLFINDCGRCDLPGGSLSEMFGSLQKIKQLDSGLVIFPGHNYGPKPFDTLGSQKRTSGVLIAETLDQFSKL